MLGQSLFQRLLFKISRLFKILHTSPGISCVECLESESAAASCRRLDLVSDKKYVRVLVNLGMFAVSVHKFLRLDSNRISESGDNTFFVPNE